jgi:hypothetical protein
MYLYHSTDNNYGAKLAWFTAEGRSIHEVATLFQHGRLKKEFIRDVNGNLEVAFYDHYNQSSLTPGERYHLFLEYNNYVCIALCFKKGSFISDIYCMSIDTNINTSTWKQLLPSRYLQKKLLAVSSTNLDPNKTLLRPIYSVTTNVEAVIDVIDENNIVPPIIHHDDEFTDYNSDEYIPSVEPIDEVDVDEMSNNLVESEFPIEYNNDDSDEEDTIDADGSIKPVLKITN